jgi:hypothetical protein
VAAAAGGGGGLAYRPPWLQGIVLGSRVVEHVPLVKIFYPSRGLVEEVTAGQVELMRQRGESSSSSSSSSFSVSKGGANNNDNAFMANSGALKQVKVP